METEILAKENYIIAIRNSVGTNIFRNLYAEINKERKDIVEDGNLSCALFVSSILFLFKMIDSVHATVSSTVRDMENSGWVKINEPKEGSVVIWEKTNYGSDGEPHAHIGFITKNDMAVSNDFEAKSPIEHELDFRGRKIEKILWNTKLK